MALAPIGNSAFDWPRAAGIRKVLFGAALVVDAGNDARPETADVPSGADKTVATILGEIVWLMSQSAEFKQCLISDLEWLVMPPILLRQFRIFYREGMPVAAVSYARVSKENEIRLKTASARTLQASEWKSGSIPVIISVFAPFGGGDYGKETLDFINRIV